jgi:serralysin
MPKSGPVSDTVLATQMLTGYWSWRTNGEEPEPRAFKNEGSSPITDITVNLSDLGEAHRDQVELALRVWEDVASINFRTVTGAAEITFNDNGKEKAGTTKETFYDALTGRRWQTQATVDVSPDWAEGPGHGSWTYFFKTLVHETGHALGLGHTGNYNGSADYNSDETLFANDTWERSIMSYHDQSHIGGTRNTPMTPQNADILTIQHMYGAATTRTGSSVYGFNSNVGDFYDFDTYTTVRRPNAAPAFTIYDSGGVDKLDCSEFTSSQTISLEGGTTSSIGNYKKNISIYTTTVIENVDGGSGADTIKGNGAGNIIVGHGGFDKMNGMGGADTFVFFKYDTDSKHSNADMITGFSQAEHDKIDFSHRDANSQVSGDQAFTFIGNQAFHKVAGELHYTIEGGNTWVEGDTNGNGKADFTVRLIGSIALTHSEFAL